MVDREGSSPHNVYQHTMYTNISAAGMSGMGATEGERDDLEATFGNVSETKQGKKSIKKKIVDLAKKVCK